MQTPDFIMFMQYAEYAVKRGIAAPGPSFEAFEPDLKLHRDRSILSHNGSLNISQKRSWGVNAYKTAGGYKSPLISKPANLYPCALLARDVSLQSAIPFSALTIGHQDFKQGRNGVILFQKAVLNWLRLSQTEGAKDQIFDMWSIMHDNGESGNICVAAQFTDWHEEWSQDKGFKLKVTPELEQAREDGGQWGEW